MTLAGSRWVRVVVAALAAEIVPIALLVAAVVLFGPGNATGDQAFADRTGRWLGPVAGALCTCLAGWWAARSQPSVARRTGLIVGLLAAASDVSILVVTATRFEWLFVFSNGLRVAAGTIGGAAAARTS